MTVTEHVRRLYQWKDRTDPGKTAPAKTIQQAAGDPRDYVAIYEDVPAGQEPQLVSSELAMDRTSHCIALDVDMPCHLVESSPGRFHLFIDRKLTWTQYRRFLVACEEAGVIEPGYLEASLVRQFTVLRLHDDSPRTALLPGASEPF